VFSRVTLMPTVNTAREAILDKRPKIGQR